MVVIAIRGSGVWLVRKCAASLRPDGVRSNSSGKPADLGRAVHFLQAERARGREPSIENTAEVFQVDDDELRLLDRIAQNALQQLREWFPLPESERYLEWEDEANGLRLSGHIDLSSLNLDHTTGFFLDYKSGRGDSDNTDQGYAYAKLLFEAYPQISKVCGIFLLLREQDRDTTYYTREDVEAWWAQVVEETKYQDTYRPGKWCAWCPRGITCEAKTGLVRQAAESLVNLPLGDVLGSMNLPTDPELRAGIFLAVLDRVKLLDEVCDTVRKAIKADVISHGGLMSGPDGRELKISTTDKKEIHYRKGARLVLQHLGNEIHDCLRISKTRVIEKIRDKAPYRGKKKAEEAFLAELEGADALVTLSVDRLDVRRSKKQLTQTEGETNGNSNETCAASSGASNNHAQS